MRLKMIWQLMRVNILYAGQAGALVRYRQRQAANPNKKLDVPMILIRQYLLVGAMYVFLFCFMNGFFQLAGAPIRFTVIVSYKPIGPTPIPRAKLCWPSSCRL